MTNSKLRLIKWLTAATPALVLTVVMGGPAVLQLAVMAIRYNRSREFG